jgi:hypothetical protein
MQQPIGRGYPAEVSAIRLPVRLSSPLQGSFRFRYGTR